MAQAELYIYCDSDWSTPLLAVLLGGGALYVMGGALYGRRLGQLQGSKLNP